MVQKGPKCQKGPHFFQVIYPQNKTKKMSIAKLNSIHVASRWKDTACHRRTHTHACTHTQTRHTIFFPHPITENINENCLTKLIFGRLQGFLWRGSKN